MLPERTERLVFRYWTPDDAVSAFEMYGDPEVARFLGSGQVQESVETQRASLERLIEGMKSRRHPGFGFWPVSTIDGDLVGALILKPIPPTTDTIEIGWHFKRRAWGHGYATEAARSVLAHAFEVVELDSVIAVLYPQNLRSANVCRRLGMTDRGLTDAYYDRPGLQLFTLSKSDWRR